MILGTVFIVIFAISEIRSITKEARNIYNHPFTVSNAAKEIRISMVSMHRNMKDVVLAENPEQVERARAAVDQHEAVVFENFKIIFDRFLGDKEQIHRVYQSFVEWRIIRNDVIALRAEGRIQEAAAITKGRGAEHVELLNTQTNALVDFAAGKAREFIDAAEKRERQSVMIMGLIGGIAVLLAIGTSIYILRMQREADLQIKRRSHLIDQNIMIARLDKDGKIQDISNHLCRFLDRPQEEFIGTNSRFFLQNDMADEMEDEIWRQLKSGSSWEGEIAIAPKGGHQRWAKLRIVPNYNGEYEIEGYTCLLSNRTNKKLSQTDNLTHLGNRRQYDEVLNREIHIAQRHDSYLTLAILDIDFFKKYNDAYGHPAGDHALEKVGETILLNLHRPDDYAFRIGGEEFAIIFTGQNGEQSRAFLESIRKAISAMNLPHMGSTVADHLTISIGAVTKTGGEILDEEQLYIDADKALYLAKETRNRTVMAHIEAKAA